MMFEYTVESLLEPAVQLIFEAFQRPILLSKSEKLTNGAGYNKGRALITILRYLHLLLLLSRFLK